MDAQEMLWQTVRWGAALIAGAALLVGADVLPSCVITFLGDTYVERVVAVSLVALFAIVLPAGAAKVVAKVFREGFL